MNEDDGVNVFQADKRDLLDSNTIYFTINTEDTVGEEMLRIGPEGFFVKGKKVAADYAVYKGFMEWLNESRKKQGWEALSVVEKEEEGK